MCMTQSKQESYQTYMDDQMLVLVFFLAVVVVANYVLFPTWTLH